MKKAKSTTQKKSRQARHVVKAATARKRRSRSYQQQVSDLRASVRQVHSELDAKNAQLRGEMANDLDPMDERYLQPNYSDRRKQAISDGWVRGWVRGIRHDYADGCLCERCSAITLLDSIRASRGQL